MLDLIRIRNNKEQVKLSMKNRGENFNISLIDELLKLDEKRRQILGEAEVLRQKKKQVSSEASGLKKEEEKVHYVKIEMKKLGQEIKQHDISLDEINERIKYIMLRIPNIPNPEVPEGKNVEDNIEIKKWGQPTKFDFEVKAHWDIGVNLDILDFQRAGKVAGPRFAVYKAAGARLERAVINYFLDTHVDKNGYTEIFTPYIVNKESMIGTGQLPKFEEDTFKINNSDYFLIPTAEVPVTNLFRDEILNSEDLPIKYVAYSACFRAEKSSAGRDTRGLIRQHQFNKVELVKFSKPEQSYEELEKLVKDAEVVLQGLKLPYRIVKVCRGDLGFTAAFKYDIEVWMPSYKKYVEISSCSNFEDFQARRANIKYKENRKSKPRFVHTLNGSALAIGRTVAAILENYQKADETVEIPQVLIPYIGGKCVIK